MVFDVSPAVFMQTVHALSRAAWPLLATTVLPVNAAQPVSPTNSVTLLSEILFRFREILSPVHSSFSTFRTSSPPWA
jgi:hypothetical protein